MMSIQSRFGGAPEYTDEVAYKAEATVATLKKIAAEHSPATVANSYGAEDMVLMDLIARHKIGLGMFSLDTGRLPAETYAVMDAARTRYHLDVDVLFPQTFKLQEFLEREGFNPFYQSVELRKACCGHRKVEPLGRALAGKAAWVTGLRREQAPTRNDLGVEEFDAGHNMPKFNPLIEWTERDIWAYIFKFDVPYNGLHDQGYPSIGCAPCTRAIAAGEDVRAGRWWWENPESKECGLHAPNAAA